jgi:hypothetical protein
MKLPDLVLFTLVEAFTTTVCCYCFICMLDLTFFWQDACIPCSKQLGIQHSRYDFIFTLLLWVSSAPQRWKSLLAQKSSVLGIRLVKSLLPAFSWSLSIPPAHRILLSLLPQSFLYFMLFRRACALLVLYSNCFIYPHHIHACMDRIMALNALWKFQLSSQSCFPHQLATTLILLTKKVAAPWSDQCYGRTWHLYCAHWSQYHVRFTLLHSCFWLLIPF